MRRVSLLLSLAALALGLAALPPALISRPEAGEDFVHFESGHVHPAALTPGGQRLLVVNTPDDRLSVFDLGGALPVKIGEIPVGLEPVSVAAFDDQTAWVVNQLSDDVSVVDLTTLHVKATLRVGDEPADVAFVGGEAYVSVAQEDVVKVFDAATLAPIGTPIAIGGRMPRALARSADGSRVYVAVLNAGNRTSVLAFGEALDSLPAPNPPMDPTLPVAPDVGLIVQRQGADWRDEAGKLWNAKIKYVVNDVDVAEIGTATHAVTRTLGDLATLNLGLAVASDGRVAVTGTEARNLVRFEPNLRGHNVDTRLSLIPQGLGASVRDLNPHVNYSVTPGPQAERDSALGNPTGVAFSADGHRAYVTSLASNRLGVIDADGGPATSVLARVPTVAGPTGVVVDAARGRIYVVGRFRNELQTLSAATLGTLGVTGIGFDPTPDAIVNGRKFFYGGFTSGHGEHACATCHVFGDFDNIAWDLGDPQGDYLPPPPGMIDPLLEGFHPMKGPMTTQSLRGLPGTGVLHWRGDRANLAAFNPAFVSLLGRATPLPDSEMTAFSDFVLALRYPPSPGQFLNRTQRDAPPGQPSALRGQNFFMNQVVDGPFTCNTCHAAGGFGPGTNGQLVNDAALLEDQDIKIPQLRNLYKKTGFTDLPGAVNRRGFGFIHDGSVDNLFDFLKFPGFNFGVGAAGDNNRRDVEAFLLAFDTGLAPAVGFQVTFNGAPNPLGAARVDTLRGQVTAGAIDLVAKGRVAGQPRGWLFLGGDAWRPDKPAEANLTTAQLVALGTGAATALTITGVPPGGGLRCGIDRDRDGYLDGEELDAGSDPGNPASTPATVDVGDGRPLETALERVSPNPARGPAEIGFALARGGPVDLAIYDLMGREVRVLARGRTFAAGRWSLGWDGRQGDGQAAGAGVYFVRLRAGAGSWSRTLVRIR